MRYYVLGQNGERYGPADVPTLNEWAAASRLFPTSKLMEEMSGSVVAASSVPGISFGPAQPAAPMMPIAPPTPGQPFQPPAPGNPYARPGYAPQALRATGGKNDLLLSFGMVLLSPALSLFCIYGFTTALVGIAAGWRAYQNGQKIALLAVVLNVAALVFWALSRFVFRMWLYNRY